MKIIITEDQVNLLNEGTNKSVKLLTKYYNIEDDGSSYRGSNQIQTFVTIDPKDYDNELTPVSVMSTCNWEIGYDNELIFKFMTMPNPRTIPLMEYIGIWMTLINTLRMFIGRKPKGMFKDLFIEETIPLMRVLIRKKVLN